MAEDVIHYTIASAPRYPDKTAVHLAAAEVLDHMYGAERGNEIFFVFPADYIASQHSYAFNGWERERDFANPQSESKWNDVFVWPGKEKGISIDAGFVFIPDNIKVDPTTGSRYASQIVDVNGKQKRVLIEDAMASPDLKNWLTTNTDKLDLYVGELKANSGGSSGEYDRTQNRILERISNDLVQKGWDQTEAWIAADDIWGKYWQFRDAFFKDDNIAGILQKSGKLYKKPDTTISSKEYWEKYFTDHLDQKPSHVLYYSGNPTVATYNRLQKEGIAEKGKDHDPLLGFAENCVGGRTEMRTDPRANEGFDRIVQIADRIIDAHYTRANMPKAA